MVDLYQYIEETAEFKLPPILVGKRKQPLVPLVPTEIFSDDVIVKILEGDQPQYFEKAQEAPLLSGDFEIEREDRPEQRFVFREEIESSAAIPLKATGETVGVMFVNYRSPQLFGPGQREQIELFANQAAIAIENARLYKQLERKYMELETEYIAREQLAALGTATAALQHRISNTLNLVNPGIMRLRRRIDPNDKDTAETLDIMERNVRYTSQIISRLQEPLKEETATVTDVNSRLKEIVQDVREKETEMCQKVSFDLDSLSPCIPRIEIGTGQLTEVLRNLVENACKAMQSQGGTLTLSSRLVGSTIEVEFQDTGPGIPPNIRERLFTRPVPPKDFGAGTGLGLWLSKLILQKYGGDIEVKETSEGGGTTMLIRLPTIQQPTT
jgi:signal transduction histidine kinase